MAVKQWRYFCSYPGQVSLLPDSKIMPRVFNVIISQLLGKAGFISGPCFLILVIKEKTVPQFVRVEGFSPSLYYLLFACLAQE